MSLLSSPYNVFFKVKNSGKKRNFQFFPQKNEKWKARWLYKWTAVTLMAISCLMLNIKLFNFLIMLNIKLFNFLTYEELRGKSENVEMWKCFFSNCPIWRQKGKSGNVEMCFSFYNVASHRSNYVSKANFSITKSSSPSNRRYGEAMITRKYPILSFRWVL